jgi:hypothetical protein
MELLIDIPLSKQIGLGQLGNSCYMASFLQIFYRLNIDYNEILDRNTIENINLNLQIINNRLAIDIYNDKIIFIKKLNDLIQQFMNSTSISTTKIKWRDISRYLKMNILYIDQDDISQQDSSMVLSLLLEKLLYPYIQIGYIDETIKNYYDNFFYKLYEIHSYVPKNYVENYILIGENIHKMYYSKNFVGRNIQFNLISKIQCDRCKSFVITKIKDSNTNLEVNQYTINLLTNNCIYEKIQQSCEFCFREEEAQYKSEININWNNPIEVNDYQTKLFNEIYLKFQNNFGQIISDAKYKNIKFYQSNKTKVYSIFDNYHIYEIYNVKLYIQDNIIGTRKILNFNRSNNDLLENHSRNLVNLQVTKTYKQNYLKIFYKYIKDYINESGRFISLLLSHTEKTYFLTIPNILLLYSVRDFKEGNLTGIFNTPKLTKNLNILLPIFDDNLNIKRYTNVQYTLKMLNVGPSQETINETTIINYKGELSNIIIELLKRTGKNLLECREELMNIFFENTKLMQRFDRNIFKNKMIEIFETLDYLEIDEQEKLNKFMELLENNIIVPFNVLQYKPNSGHYKSVIRNDINNDEEKDYKWTEFDDDRINKNIDLNYKSAFYDNARIYVYTRD